MQKIKSSEITPENLYLNRRSMLKATGIFSASALLAACRSLQGATPTEKPLYAPNVPLTGVTPTPIATPKPGTKRPVDEFGDWATPLDVIENYNNFFEFSPDKQAVARLSQDFVTDPWSIMVGGLVHKPKTFGLEELVKLFGEEERVYRLRCVEGWSMVIPWLGFPLHKLLAEVEPKSEAAFVRFETLNDPAQFPNLSSRVYEWPYVEGLRIDEAMHDLTLLSTGLYGKQLAPQNGAPIRLVVPWKYGFKSIKSIVKIDLVKEMPISFWMKAGPKEYGFYSNVNPEVAHPRWTQSNERRIGELERRTTLPFNGYAEQVADLYAGMDLSEPNERSEIGPW
jgi:sulfoxide reductase catalytic subunit YedY